MLFTLRETEREIKGCDNIVKKTDNGLYYVANKSGDKLTKRCYRFISDFKNGIAVVAVTKSTKIQRKYHEEKVVKEIPIYPEGLIDVNGNEILPCIYDKVKIADDCIRLCIDDKWGYADFTGKVIVEPKYMFIENFNGNARVYDGEKWGTIDFTGKVIIPLKFDYISALKDNVRIAKRYGRYYGVIDDYGNILKPYIYDELRIDNVKKQEIIKSSITGETFIL